MTTTGDAGRGAGSGNRCQNAPGWRWPRCEAARAPATHQERQPQCFPVQLRVPNPSRALAAPRSPPFSLSPPPCHASIALHPLQHRFILPRLGSVLEQLRPDHAPVPLPGPFGGDDALALSAKVSPPRTPPPQEVTCTLDVLGSRRNPFQPLSISGSDPRAALRTAPGVQRFAHQHSNLLQPASGWSPPASGAFNLSFSFNLAANLAELCPSAGTTRSCSAPHPQYPLAHRTCAVPAGQQPAPTQPKSLGPAIAKATSHRYIHRGGRSGEEGMEGRGMVVLGRVELPKPQCQVPLVLGKSPYRGGWKAFRPPQASLVCSSDAFGTEPFPNKKPTSLPWP